MTGVAMYRLTGEVPAGAADVLAERKRQIEVEGYDSHHDDANEPGDMAVAGACYALHAGYSQDPDHPAPFQSTPPMWPWADRYWKPRTIRDDLVRAAALIIAEIDAIDRAEAAKAGGTE